MAGMSSRLGLNSKFSEALANQAMDTMFSSIDRFAHDHNLSWTAVQVSQSLGSDIDSQSLGPRRAAIDLCNAAYADIKTFVYKAIGKEGKTDMYLPVPVLVSSIILGSYTLWYLYLFLSCICVC
jgi:hypothetical protein